MSIFSSIGSALGSAARWVGNAATNVYNTVSNAFSGGTSQTAAVGGLNFNNPVNNALQATRPLQGYGTASWGGAAGGTTSSGGSGGGGWGSTQVIGPQLPVQINAGQQKTQSSGGGGSSFATSSSPMIQSYPISQAPITVSRQTLSTASPTTTGGSVGTIGGGQPLGLGSTPQSVNANRVDTTRLAGLTAGVYQVGADGTLTEVKQETPEERLNNKVTAATKLYKDIMGEPKIAAEDPEVIAARQQRQQIQQALLAPTAELNAVIAKQNTDLLTHRKMVSEGGGTTTGFGGIEAAINYNAAIRALPLQASIASLQGDLKLAQDYLTELTQIKTEQIKAQHDYNMGLINAIQPIIAEEDRRAYEELKTEVARQTKNEDDLVNFQAQLAMKVYENSDGRDVTSIVNRITSSKDKMSAVQAAGQYGGDMLARENKQLQNQKLVEEINKIVADRNASNVTFDTSTDAGQLSSVAQNLASKFNSKFSQEQFLSNVNRLAKSGDTAQLADYIFSEAISNIGDTDTRKKAFGNYRVVKQLSMLEQQLSDYEANGGNTNILVGKKENVLAKLGTVQNVKLREIGTAITNTMDELARARTGAVISESEEKMYRQILPGIDKTGTLNKAIISGLNMSLTNDIDSILKFQLTGSGFDTISKYLKLEPTGTQGASTAKEGDTKVYNGMTFKLINGVWTEQ